MISDALNSLKTRHIQKRGMPARLPSMHTGSVINNESVENPNN